jgi:hypothetical protein
MSFGLLSIGLLPAFLLGVTIAGILGIIIHRTVICRFWRTESNDRRKECDNFNGPDRRREARRGSAADRRK